LTAPLVLSAGARTAGGFHFKLSGSAGSEYFIVYSTDLVHWTPLGSITAAGKLADYTDALNTNAAAGFYRATVQSKP